MTRRQFVAASAASSALAVSRQTSASTPAAATSREHYLLRRYTMRTGPQTTLTEHFFSEALIPALNRLGHTPVGAFKLDIGPETPAFYLLVPGASVEGRTLSRRCRALLVRAC
jgi:hypothetical protein